VHAFKLGASQAVPAIEVEAEQVPAPPAMTVSAAELEAGGALYTRFCGVCHGVGAIGGG
ncbi:MAG: cytochrome c, partial [Actinobacteria bacterium]|nr:cytochrome c [Actinomycetota bacterium]